VCRQCIDRVTVRHIGGYGNGVPTYRIPRGQELVSITVYKHDNHAQTGEPVRSGKADAIRGSGNDGYVVGGNGGVVHG
jgi:hypothetical protein